MALLQIYLNQLLLFVLVLTRVSGLVMTAPMFGSRAVPLKIRAMLAVGVSLIVTPLQVPPAAGLPTAGLQLVVLLARELMLGLALGLAVMVVFAGMQLAGQLIGQMSGTSLADVFDPSFEAEVPVYSQVLDMVALAAFLAIGGHRQVLGALLDSFGARPLGSLDFPMALIPALSDVVGDSFEIGLRVAAPLVVALLLAVLILGLISRTMPQLNVIAVGFNLNSLILLAVLSLGLVAMSDVVQVRAAEIIEAIQSALVYD